MTDRQSANFSSSSSQPLLREDREAARDIEHQDARDGGIGAHYTYHRQRIQKFLASKTQHYLVLALVSLDLLSIFADIFIVLYTCEEGDPSATWDEIRNGLGIAGLVFSCLFMTELILSVWAYGWQYFKSWFHCLDATVIVAGFFIDVLLRGVLEEIASLVVVLRLWRFFKIIEEFSVGAEEQMDALSERLEMLEHENKQLKEELETNRQSKLNDEELGLMLPR